MYDNISQLYNNQPYLGTEVILHQLQPMNNQSGNDEIMIKVEVEESYYDNPNIIGTDIHF
jgi:hypothetical protein